MLVICYIEAMKRQSALITVLYGYISFAFFMVVLDAFDIFHPLPDIIAALSLLTASFYVGKYSKPKE